MKQHSRFIRAALLAALVSTALLFAQSNPAVGAWKLNLKKSKAGNAPLSQSEMRNVEARGDGMKVDYDGIDASGESFSWGYVANFDGKDSPISGMGQPAETIAIERIDSNTYRSTLKKAGQVISIAEIVVSKNGKVTTFTIKGSDANGQPTTAVKIYDRQ